MAKSDWELGQALINQGSCTLDQVREILSLQDRMRRMGAPPKSFARILLEKGYARRDQLLAAGAGEADLPPPPGDTPAEAPVSPRPSGEAGAGFAFRSIAWGVGLIACLSVLILLARGTFSTAPPTDPGPAPMTEEDRNELSRTELDGIGAIAARSAEYDNAPDVVHRYQAYEAAHAGSRWEVEAHRRLKEYRDRLEVPAKAEFEELESAAAPLREHERWTDLLGLLGKYPEKFLRTTDSGGRVQGRIQEVSQKLAEIFARGRADVIRFAEAKKYSDALARVKSLEAVAPADRRQELFELRAHIESESRGVAERARQEVADAYFKVDGPFKEALLRRDGHRAALVVREFLVEPWKDDERPFVRVAGVDYVALLKAFDPWNPDRVASICDAAIPEVDSPEHLGTGEGALLALRNAAYMAIFFRDEVAQFRAAAEARTPLELPGLGKGHFEKKNGKTVFLGESGTELEAETSPLTPSDLAALAMMVGPETAEMHARVGFFYFYSVPQALDAAYEHLAKAYSLGARGVKLYLGGLAVAADSELRRRLETKFGTAQDLYREHQWPQVKRLLGELLQYPDHEFTRSVRPEIEKMMFEIAEGTDQEKRLAVQYLGRVQLVDPSTLRVSYDFESAEQEDAFELIREEGARKFKGRWGIARGAMESGPEASVMRWKPALRGDFTVEYDLTPVDEPQNIVLDLCYHRGRSAHYAVILGFDWVGKRDGDRDNTAEDRFGMPRTCVIKYPVAVDKSRWQDSSAWDGWKSRLVGKPAQPWKAEKGKVVRIRVEREGAHLRVLADRVLVWEGQDGDYTEGQLLFYSDRRCRIDNLVITFKPHS